MNGGLRIGTFNLESLDDTAGVPLPDRIAVLRPQIERLDADILCLQEINARHVRKDEPRTMPALDRLLEGTPWAGFHRAARDPAGKLRDRHNPVILSRWPIRAVHTHLNDLVPAPQVRLVTAEPPWTRAEPVVWDRPVLHAAIGLPGGRTLHVLDVHLRAPLAAPVPGRKLGALAWAGTAGWAEGYYVAALKRAGQALEARLAVDRILDSERDPLICVAGDFNAGIDQTAVRILRAETEDTGNPALAGRSLTALDRDLPAERRYSVLHAGAPIMLDHLLVSAALRRHLLAVEIHNEDLRDEVTGHTAGHTPDSFHAPMVATFRMPD